MSTGNPNLDSKLDKPPESPTPADKLLEDMEGLADRLARLDEPMDIDPKDLLPGAASSLACLGMMYPEAGRTEVSFGFHPDVTEIGAMTWLVSVTLLVYGDLEASLDPGDMDSTPEMEDHLLEEVFLEGKAYADMGLATLSLVEQIRDKIHKEAVTRNTQSEQLSSSLDHIDSQGNLSDLWKSVPVKRPPASQ